jgi:hypothetical protein
MEVDSNGAALGDTQSRLVSLLPPAQVVQPPQTLYNGVPFILPTLHPPDLGTELSSSEINKRKGKEAKREPHTHGHSTRAQAAKGGGKTSAAIVEYQPDPADPYTPRIEWPKSSGKQAGREYFSAKPRRPTLLSRLDRTLVALGVKQSVPEHDAAPVSDDESSIDRKDEAAGKPRRKRVLMPLGIYQCNACKEVCRDHKTFQQHVFGKHPELCQRPADMETTRDNGNL